MTTSLASLGWDAKFEAAYQRFDRRGNRPGRIARVDRGVCTVLTATGTIRASLAGRMLGLIAKDPLAMPSVGDWAAIRRWDDDRYTIEAVLPRRSAIVRMTAGKAAEGQAIAANADTVAVVESLDPDPDPGRIERLMALAHESGATPLLLLTKADTVADLDLLIADLTTAAPPGTEVLAVSSHTGLGLDRLREYVAEGRTLALIGASGAGKSTLVNTVVGADVMATRRLRADGRGRHTTSYRAMVPIPGGGVILDTPGLRAVGLFDRRPGDSATPVDGLAKAFEDLERLAASCRFTDCRHEAEPDCAVQAAVEIGDLTVRRLENWRKLQREQSRERARVSARTKQGRKMLAIHGRRSRNTWE
ncbi:ribosome biogenesis GTPase [Stackebrandtia endophytica]|uniref:Small ribosomal subunit biogenesis GTPase RsgA n=1 Tax=Stackebrandtia endophytica TaxID=1496996 RepID=A0A543B458_9ACTN|nr:ribosome small subunit-dependent GTPase A [Stackebrandtia endophytica]TQL79583.1 ribosome biogenesis GTPase [Stackebrandtia endophytica]